MHIISNEHAGDGRAICPAIRRSADERGEAGVVGAPRRSTRGRWAAACLLSASLLAGCAAWRPTTVPLRVVAAPATCRTLPDTVLVLLPGSYSLPEDFVREGFVAALRQRRVAVDVLLVDAHVGYYRERSIVERLRIDVIGPARSRYRHVWIGGISLGGLGAMLYDEARPGDVEGIVALAPYLGSATTAQSVRLAGGLRAWQPPSSAADDLDGTLWRWLRQRAVDPAAPPSLTLGYGLSDRFVASDDVLAAALPASRVFTAPGGHDWPVWKVLWSDLLPTLPWPVDASCS